MYYPIKKISFFLTGPSSITKNALFTASPLNSYVSTIPTAPDPKQRYHSADCREVICGFIRSFTSTVRDMLSTNYFSGTAGIYIRYPDQHPDLTEVVKEYSYIFRSGGTVRVLDGGRSLMFECSTYHLSSIIPKISSLLLVTDRIEHSQAGIVPFIEYLIAHPEDMFSNNVDQSHEIAFNSSFGLYLQQSTGFFFDSNENGVSSLVAKIMFSHLDNLRDFIHDFPSALELAKTSGCFIPGIRLGDLITFVLEKADNDWCPEDEIEPVDEDEDDWDDGEDDDDDCDSEYDDEDDN